MDYKKLGNILKNARINSGFTQTDAAKFLSVTFQNISSWELGKSKIDIDSFTLLCDKYDIDFVDTLLAANDTSRTEKRSDTNINDSERDLLKSYRLLNKNGKIKAYEYISDLAVMDKYLIDKSKAMQSDMEAAKELMCYSEENIIRRDKSNHKV